jgi:hypothetical protein
MLEVMRVAALDINFLPTLLPSVDGAADDAMRPEEFGRALGPFPADASASWPAYPHRVVLLRPELVTAWYEDRLVKASRVLLARRAAEAEQAGPDDAKAEAKPPVAVTLQELEEHTPLRLNPDLFVAARTTPADPLASPEGRAAVDVADFLRTSMVPLVAAELVATLPTDSATVADLCHMRGVNLRYLGALTREIEAQSEQLGPRASLAIDQLRAEMIGRAAKNELRQLLRTAPRTAYAVATAHFINCYLATSTYTPAPVGAEKTKPAASHKGSRRNKRSTAAPPAAAAEPRTRPPVDATLGFAMPVPNELLAPLTPTTVWAALVERVRACFRYELPTAWRGPSAPLHRLGALRALCMATGVQVAAKSYQFDAAHGRVVAPADIGGVQPLVAHSYGQVRRVLARLSLRAICVGVWWLGRSSGRRRMQVSDAVRTFEAGRMRLAQGL